MSRMRSRLRSPAISATPIAATAGLRDRRSLAGAEECAAASRSTLLATMRAQRQLSGLNVRRTRFAFAAAGVLYAVAGSYWRAEIGSAIRV